MDWDQFKFTPTPPVEFELWPLPLSSSTDCWLLSPPEAPTASPPPPAKRHNNLDAKRAFMALSAASFQQSLMVYWRTPFPSPYTCIAWKYEKRDIYNRCVCNCTYQKLAWTTCIPNHDLFISAGPSEPFPHIYLYPACRVIKKCGEGHGRVSFWFVHLSPYYSRVLKREMNSNCSGKTI